MEGLFDKQLFDIIEKRYLEEKECGYCRSHWESMLYFLRKIIKCEERYNECRK